MSPGGPHCLRHYLNFVDSSTRKHQISKRLHQVQAQSAVDPQDGLFSHFYLFCVYIVLVLCHRWQLLQLGSASPANVPLIVPYYYYK